MFPLKKHLHVISPFSVFLSIAVTCLASNTLLSTEGLPKIFGAVLYLFVIIVIIVITGASKPNVFPFNITGTILWIVNCNGSGLNEISNKSENYSVL